LVESGSGFSCTRTVVLYDEHASPRRSVPSSVVAIFDRFRKKAEIELTAELMRDLLRDQQPDLADRPLTLGARGWDNQLWRLGDDLAVRLPWQTETADALLLKENTWLPVLAPLLPLPVPVPQHLGQPSERYPHPWIVTTWVPGTPADHAPATCSGPAADALAADGITATVIDAAQWRTRREEIVRLVAATLG